jgi:hypothetical protein
LLASNSIENLSTLRSSDVNERERNLLDKIKHYKKENHTLISLLKDSEANVSERIQKSKRETEHILKVLNKLWPLLQRLITVDGSTIDSQTKEVLKALGDMLGKNIDHIDSIQTERNSQH